MNEIIKKEFNKIDVDAGMANYCDMSCDLCDFKFKSMPEAQYHYLHSHNITDGYIKCCTSKYRTIDKLKGHIFWHLKPEVLKCMICSKECQSITSLKMHLRIHATVPNNDQCQCNICNKQFMRKDHLAKHMRFKHGIGK